MRDERTSQRVILKEDLPVLRAVPDKKEGRSKGIWLKLGLALLALLLAAFHLYANVLEVKGSEINSEVSNYRAPDGVYLAQSIYREDLRMTYGYYRVRLVSQPIYSFPSSEIVTEFDAEGLSDVSWQDARTLVVTYDKSEAGRDPLVVQKRSWRDVRISYRRKK